MYRFDHPNVRSLWKITRRERERERESTVSCRPPSGPLLNCVANGFADFELPPAAAKASSLRCPSASSPLKVRVIVDAELIAS